MLILITYFFPIKYFFFSFSFLISIFHEKRKLVVCGSAQKGFLHWYDTMLALKNAKKKKNNTTSSLICSMIFQCQSHEKINIHVYFEVSYYPTVVQNVPVVRSDFVCDVNRYSKEVLLNILFSACFYVINFSVYFFLFLYKS